MDLNLDEIIIKEILPKKSFFFNSTEMLRIPFSMIYLIIISLIIFNTSGFKYPISVDEIAKVYGVGEGKAKKYGKEFAEFVAKYVEDNNIERTQDMVLKTVANKSSHKVFIIQNTGNSYAVEGKRINGVIKNPEGTIYLIGRPVS